MNKILQLYFDPQLWLSRHGGEIAGQRRTIDSITLREYVVGYDCFNSRAEGFEKRALLALRKFYTNSYLVAI